jgi:hypothetical protein
MSPTPEQLNAVADWLEEQAVEAELHDVRQALKRELQQLGAEYPSLQAIVDEAQRAGHVDEEGRQQFWHEARELLRDDLERKQRISEMLYVLVQANRRKTKHVNGTPRTLA